MLKTVALVIGHSPGRQGARNPDTIETEYQYNFGLAAKMMGLAKPHLYAGDLDLRIFHRGDVSSDSVELNALIDHINFHKPDLVVELHADSTDAPGDHTGHSVLHYEGSAKGAQIAHVFANGIKEALGNNFRGVVGRDDLAMVKKTNALANIVEPFFINNFDDLQNARLKQTDLAYWLVRCMMDLIHSKMI